MDCGTRVKRNMKAGRAKVCADCGWARAKAAALGMASKSGSHYAKFLAARWPDGAANARQRDLGE